MTSEKVYPLGLDFPHSLVSFRKGRQRASTYYLFGKPINLIDPKLSSKCIPKSCALCQPEYLASPKDH